MAFTAFSTNVKNLENLGTNKPNTDLSMTGLQLRQLFDKAVGDIKTWINDTFLSEIAGTSAAGNIGMTQITGLQSTNIQAALSEIYGHTGDTSDASITLGKLASGFSLPTANIADSAITSAKLGANAVSTDYTATLYYTDWSGNTAPYTMVKSISGITADDKPIVDLVASDTFATAENEIEAWNYVYRGDTATDQITFYATKKPETTVTVKLRCIRK